MAVLSSAYINWKLAAEGSTQATKELILTFLNDAANAAAIAGIEAVDVAAIAKRLDRDLSEPPKPQDLEADPALDRSPKPMKVDKQERARLMERLPEPVLRNGWLKVIVPDGEIAREGDELVYRSAGVKPNWRVPKPNASSIQ
jgi:hypothetical protein